MSLDANRSAIVSAVEAARLAWTGSYTLNIEYDNRDTVDLAAQLDPYLMIDIVYMDGRQMDLGKAPLIGDYGQIMLAAGVKKGAGTDGVMKLLQFIRPYLELKDTMGSVRTSAAKLTKYVEANGFYYQPMLIPFWEIHVSG